MCGTDVSSLPPAAIHSFLDRNPTERALIFRCVPTPSSGDLRCKKSWMLGIQSILKEILLFDPEPSREHVDRRVEGRPRQTKAEDDGRNRPAFPDGEHLHVEGRCVTGSRGSYVANHEPLDRSIRNEKGLVASSSRIRSKLWIVLSVDPSTGKRAWTRNPSKTTDSIASLRKTIEPFHTVQEGEAKLRAFLPSYRTRLAFESMSTNGQSTHLPREEGMSDPTPNGRLHRFEIRIGDRVGHPNVGTGEDIRDVSDPPPAECWKPPQGVPFRRAPEGSEGCGLSSSVRRREGGECSIGFETLVGRVLPKPLPVSIRWATEGEFIPLAS